MDKTSPTKAAAEERRPPFLRLSSVAKTAMILTFSLAFSRAAMISSALLPSLDSLKAYSASTLKEIQKCFESKTLTLPSKSAAASVALWKQPDTPEEMEAKIKELI